MITTDNMFGFRNETVQIYADLRIQRVFFLFHVKKTAGLPQYFKQIEV